MNRLKPPPHPSPRSKPDPVPFDAKPMAPKRDLLDHAFDPPSRAFDPIWPMPLDPNPLPFENDSLDRAVACVRKYLELGNSAEWFHVQVRTVAFPGFLRAMDADRGQTRTLPFSCWCDGGKSEEPRLRQHRHAIVVSSPPGHFVKNVWGKIIVEDRPRKNFKCLYSEKLVSAMHLVNTIGYLCKRESRCDFSSSENKKILEKLNHFYLFESLPKDYRLPLVLQWPGGLLQLLDQTFRHFKLDDLSISVASFFENKWRFRIKDIPGIALGTVLPVAKEFRPCPFPTDSFLHLTEGRKLFFERDPVLPKLTPDAWLKEQADMGNLFYHVVGEERWTPRPYHQALLNVMKPIVDRNAELESEIARTKETCRLKHEPLEERAARWKRKCKAAEQENKSLANKNSKLNDKIHQLNDEIHHLNKVEIARLKRENEAEIARLKRENEAEIARLKRENEVDNARLKSENEKVLKELARLQSQFS